MESISPAQIKEIYLAKKLSCRKIGRIMGCNKNTVVSSLKKSGVALRTKNMEGKLIKRPEKISDSQGNTDRVVLGKTIVDQPNIKNIRLLAIINFSQNEKI